MANKLPAVIPSGTNKYYTPSLSFNRVATDHISAGVVGLFANTSGIGPASGNFGVSAQGSPNMTVAVNSGVAYVSATPTGGTAQLFGVTMDASENVTISANATGSTRYDFLYLKLDADKLNNPASAGTDVPTLVTQRSTTQYVDSNGALANALLLAEITVTNGASTITNANIADRRVIAEPVEHDGWVNPQTTWTYASATTLTISGDVTLRYSVGDKLSLYQSGSRKYFYVTGVSYSAPNTTLTVNGGTDYTLANATIYGNLYSKASSPNGFPQWFNYTPTFTGYTSTPTYISRFRIDGRTVHLSLTNGGTQTSNATTFTATIPVTAATVASKDWSSFLGPCADNSAACGATAIVSSAGTVANLYKNNAGSGSTWTASNNKWVDGIITYEI